MTQRLTIAHLSDVHLGPIAGFTPRYWNLKRLTGYINWQHKRSTVYQRPVLDRLVADIALQAPDHVAVTGDLANIGLPQEHANGLRWLEGLGSPDRVTVIPGNHDIYTSMGRDPGTRRWARFMAPNEAGAAFADRTVDFPFVRVLGKVALIGVNSAVPTPPMMAWGSVGEKQLAELARALERLSQAGLFRLLLIHHPPLPGQAKPARALKDAAVLESVLAGHGAELVIHGHNHLNTLAWRTTATGLLPVVGVPSGSLARPYKGEPLARYNLYRIDPDARAIELIGRGLSEPGGPVVEIERRLLVP